MRWKIGAFIFCEKTQTLSQAGADPVSMEPLLAELLSAFCRRPDRIVGRDELIETVWRGQIVTDNAIARAITKLRQALGDDAKAPQFIATYPKKGYRLIAPVTRLEDGGADPPPPTEARRIHTLGPALFAAVALVAALLIAAFWPAAQRRSPPASEFEFLTRDDGAEFQPALSPDGRHLLYTRFVEDRLGLFLKNLENGESVEIGPPQGFSGPASWSSSGRYIAYVYTEERPDGTISCELHRLIWENGAALKRETVHHCPSGSAGKVIFTHDDDRLIYAEASEAGPPYAIFELNLKNGARRRLPQPLPRFGGNTQFDLHPKRNELLISSPDEDRLLAIYSLNLDTDELRLLFRLDEYACCAVWSPDGERMTLMSEHAAYGLVSYDLKGGDRRVIHQAPHRISGLSRADGYGYVYVGGTFNRDIAAYSLAESAQRIVVQSAADDRAPALSPDGARLAFLSDRDGSDDIWSRDLESGVERKLAVNTDHRHFTDLQWSPDGARLVAASFNALYLTDAGSGKMRHLNIPRMEIRAVSWKDSRTLAFSIPVAGAWRIRFYDVVTDETNEESAPWSYVRFTSDPSDSIWVSDAGNLHVGAERRRLDIKPAFPVANGRLTFIKHGAHIYQFQRRSPRVWDFVEISPSDPSRDVSYRTIISLNTESNFNIDNDKIYYSTLISRSSDIFRIRSDDD